MCSLFLFYYLHQKNILQVATVLHGFFIPVSFWPFYPLGGQIRSKTLTRVKYKLLPDVSVVDVAVTSCASNL